MAETDLECTCVLATEGNTLGVRKGYELGGYIKERCPACESKTAGRTSVHWRYEIQHGPEGEANYAWLYDETGKLVATLQTYQATKIIHGMNAAPEFLEAARLAMEGIEVLDLLIASIAKHGNYSVESTLGFLNQARCAKLRLSEVVAKATLTQPGTAP